MIWTVLFLIGLRAIQPDAAVIKVTSIPDNRCIRVVIPDDHVPNEFHEILIHDMEEEEPPFVALSDLGCLRLDWPRSLFTFMGRYQLDLEHLRRECRGRFGSTQSRLCTFCGKYIQQNLGRHIACYHMNLSQLWRCPVTWCTVWRGTPQDCIDNMRKAHNIPATVKVANLARWFPPWTVSCEQWTIIMQSSVSRVVVDTLLLSRIGVPLFHRYLVFSWPGTHAAFRGTYMTQIRTFLEKFDAASLRSRHRLQARVIASRMSQTNQHEARGREPDSSSQPSMSRRPGSRVRKSAPAATVAAASVTSGVVRSLRSIPWTIQALMDLALPKFAHQRSGRSHLRRRGLLWARRRRLRLQSD